VTAREALHELAETSNNDHLALAALEELDELMAVFSLALTQDSGKEMLELMALKTHRAIVSNIIELRGALQSLGERAREIAEGLKEGGTDV
jgi:predicted ArsR family transcriptional regulator